MTQRASKGKGASISWAKKGPTSFSRGEAGLLAKEERARKAYSVKKKLGPEAKERGVVPRRKNRCRQSVKKTGGNPRDGGRS